MEQCYLFWFLRLFNLPHCFCGKWCLKWEIVKISKNKLLYVTKFIKMTLLKSYITLYWISVYNSNLLQFLLICSQSKHLQSCVELWELLLMITKETKIAWGNARSFMRAEVKRLLCHVRTWGTWTSYHDEKLNVTHTRGAKKGQV